MGNGESLIQREKQTSQMTTDPLEKVWDTVLELQGVQPWVAACSVAPSAGQPVVAVSLGEVVCSA